MRGQHSGVKQKAAAERLGPRWSGITLLVDLSLFINDVGVVRSWHQFFRELWEKLDRLSILSSGGDEGGLSLLSTIPLMIGMSPRYWRSSKHFGAHTPSTAPGAGGPNFSGGGGKTGE